jgi:glycerol-1-phosphate dehydrogenase [NAD(P)+]
MTETVAAARPADRPAGGWIEGIEDIYLGRWVHPETGVKAKRAPFDLIAVEESLDGAEADLVGRLGFAGDMVVVADAATWDAMGARVAKALKAKASVVLDHPHADMGAIADLAPRIAGFDHVIAVGSGTINDLCKYVTAQDGRRYCVFGTAASMDGYASTTASITIESGLKISLPAHAATGIFIDLGVNAAAPKHLAAAGFGDSICRSVAQIDWWMSHRLLGTFYSDLPYLIGGDNEAKLYARAAGLPAGDVGAVGVLHRNLLFSGLGVSFTGVSNHGSMGEHQISHYIDCFAGAKHPGTLHGQQVGVATVTMARIQNWWLDQETPPEVRATRIDPADMERRMGPAIAAQCLAEYRKKALDEAGAAALNAKLAAIWPELRAELRAFAMPVDEIVALLREAGAPTSAADLGLDAGFYREAVRHAHEMRNRFSFADLACDAGLLDDFAAAEV